MKRTALSLFATAVLAASLGACDAQPTNAAASSRASSRPSVNTPVHSADVAAATIHVACDGPNELIVSGAGWSSTFDDDLEVTAHSANCVHTPYLGKISKPNAVSTITLGGWDVARRCLGTEMLYSIAGSYSESAFVATRTAAGDPRCTHNAPGIDLR